MPTVKLLNLQVSDIIQWFRAKELIVNDVFQRRSVWTAAAKSFLIDTVLRELPIPKVYIRTKIDARTQKSVREIVDGQQRIRALVEFATNKLRLTKRAKEFKGCKYDDLTEESQQVFLGYTIAVDQLLNASDDDVLEIFARLNSYNVTLNSAEKRHAEFQTEFKFAVRETAEEWKPFFQKFEILTLKQRFRMLDDQLVAELFSVVLEGVTDGGAPRLRALYTKYDDEEFTDDLVRKVKKYLKAAREFFEEEIASGLKGEFAKPYHMLMLVAAYCHHKFGIPDGQIPDGSGVRMPGRTSVAESDVVVERLAELEQYAETPLDEIPKSKVKFWEAASASPQRIASRRIRFLEMVQILKA